MLWPSAWQSLCQDFLSLALRVLPWLFSQIDGFVPHITVWDSFFCWQSAASSLLFLPPSSLILLTSPAINLSLSHVIYFYLFLYQLLSINLSLGHAINFVLSTSFYQLLSINFFLSTSFYDLRPWCLDQSTSLLHTPLYQLVSITSFSLSTCLYLYHIHLYQLLSITLLFINLAQHLVTLCRLSGRWALGRRDCFRWQVRRLVTLCRLSGRWGAAAEAAKNRFREPDVTKSYVGF